MAVLARDTDPFPREAYDGLANSPELLAAVKAAPGFIAHLAVAGADGVTIMEVWHSRADAERFVAETILPALRQAGIPEAPRVEYQELHNLILPT
jgi:hypothetical protein